MQAQMRAEVQTFGLDVLKPDGRVDLNLCNLLTSGNVSLENARSIGSLRPRIKVWYKTRLLDPRTHTTLLQFRVSKDSKVLFTTFMAEPFQFESEMMSSQVFDFGPYRLENRAEGSWKADASVMFLTPEAKAGIRPDQFRLALTRFRYTLITEIRFVIRNNKVRVLASGELDSRQDVDELSERPISLDNI
jgi:hypothetical protein